MTAHAHVEPDWFVRGVKIHVALSDRQALSFGDVTRVAHDDPATVPDSQPLQLPDDAARALYEALAEYFGHTGHDMRALRKDYDEERARVNVLVEHLIRKDGGTA